MEQASEIALSSSFALISDFDMELNFSVGVSLIKIAGAGATKAGHPDVAALKFVFCLLWALLNRRPRCVRVFLGLPHEMPATPDNRRFSSVY